MIYYDIEQWNLYFCTTCQPQHSISEENSKMSDEDVTNNNEIEIKCDKDELSSEHYDSDEKKAYNNDDNSKESDVDEDDASE